MFFAEKAPLPADRLHFADIEKHLGVLNRLVDNKNSVLVIEHNLDVIKTADYLIDMGPEGGDAEGEVVAAGTPEEVARCERSHTGQFLKEIFEKEAQPKVTEHEAAA
jgi:excinuclease ABC subunit A